MSDRWLFRGKNIDIDEWVNGYLRKFPNYHNNAELEYAIQVIPEKGDYDNIFVDPSTIGQCTGLKDKNGKLIFEGDILKSIQYEIICKKLEDLPYAVVKWSKSQEGWRGDIVNACYEMKASTFSEAEIIGNIYDNPDLIEIL